MISYENLKELCLKMMNFVIINRPECEKILNDIYFNTEKKFAREMFNILPDYNKNNNSYVYKLLKHILEDRSETYLRELSLASKITNSLFTNTHAIYHFRRNFVEMPDTKPIPKAKSKNWLIQKGQSNNWRIHKGRL